MSDNAPASDDDGMPDELEQLWEELAGIARQTAALLIQPDYETAEVAALDTRAEALRAKIKVIQAQRRPPEPLDLWWGSRLSC